MFRFKVIIGFLCLGAALGHVLKSSARVEVKCEKELCQLPDCSCASVEIPGNLTLEETPQFVFLTFDDAITNLNMEYYREALYEGNNPDGCPHAATFFVSHEYTYYDKVDKLFEVFCFQDLIII